MRARWAIVALVCAGVVVWMLFLLRDNVVYTKPVSAALSERVEQGERRFRMNGSVVPGTIVEANGLVTFQLTEGGALADVEFTGNPPQLFAECAPVVVDGRWEGATFRSDRLLIRHGNEYEPPKGEMAKECPEEPEGVR